MALANLQQLNIFVQVSKAGSLSKAAAALEMAPSLVSRSISMLEREWGGAVFRRTGRGIVLTDFGTQMRPNAAALLEQSVQLAELAREAAKRPSGLVRLGIIPSLATSVMAALTGDLQARAPQIRLMVREGLSGHIDEWLTAGAIDLAVVNRYLAGKNTSEHTIGQLSTFLICAPDSALAAARTIPFSALAGLPLVLPHFQSGLRGALEYHARRKDITLTVAIEAESVPFMKHVAMAGDAFAILPICSVEDELAAGRLAAVKIVDPCIPRLINITSAPSKSASRAIRFTADRLQALMPPLLKTFTSG